MALIPVGNSLLFNPTNRAFYVVGTPTIIERSSPSYSWYMDYSKHVIKPYLAQRVGAIGRNQERIELKPAAFSTAGQPTEFMAPPDSAASVFGAAVLEELPK